MAPAQVVDGKLRPTGTIGHYGCQTANRLVRVGVADGLSKGPRVIEVASCPACGNRHTNVKPTWRQPGPLDEGREPEVVVEEGGAGVSEPERSCPVCGADLSGHRADAEVCGDRCRRERNRLRRLLAGQGDGPYRTVEGYLNRSQSRANRARRSLTESAAT